MTLNQYLSKKRIVILLLFITGLGGLLFLRVAYLQIFFSRWLSQAASQQRFREAVIPAQRGSIYDRLGNELAITIEADSVYLIPPEIGFDTPVPQRRGLTRIKTDPRSRAKIAQLVGGVLQLDPAYLEKQFNKQASFVWLKRNASFAEIEKLTRLLKQQKIRGIAINHSPRRFYPQTFMAAQLLGISGIDNQGLEGLEKELDLNLRGVPGRERAEYDTRGHYIPSGKRYSLAPVDGDTVYLTIDKNIQYIVERELEEAVTSTHSKRGMVLVLDPRNGEILALGSWPKYDPNHYNDYPTANRRNPIFSDMYEPGSTFKVFTVAAALEEGKVRPESSFYDPGFVTIEGQRIDCWKKEGHGQQSFRQAVANSCNPVFAELALRLQKKVFYRYLRSFGFGKVTGVNFPGEAAGRLKPLKQLKQVELANIGFGQGISVTPIQLAMGVAAVANGGYLLRPQLVKAIYGPDGKLKASCRREQVRQVMAPETAAQIVKMLELVVTEGSGSQAHLEGYRVAGKTGTAQKVAPGGHGYSQLIASFIGFAPTEQSQILVMVILDEPNAPVKYGGVIAAPVAGKIIRDTLRYLGVKPQYNSR